MEARARDELHRHVADAVLFAGGVNGDDVRMAEPRHGAHLAQEPLGALAGAEDVGPEDLDRDLAAERLVVREEHGAHRSGADARAEPVRADALDRRCLRRRVGPPTQGIRRGEARRRGPRTCFLSVPRAPGSRSRKRRRRPPRRATRDRAAHRTRSGRHPPCSITLHATQSQRIGPSFGTKAKTTVPAISCSVRVEPSFLYWPLARKDAIPCNALHRPAFSRSARFSLRAVSTGLPGQTTTGRAPSAPNWAASGNWNTACRARRRPPSSCRHAEQPVDVGRRERRLQGPHDRFRRDADDPAGLASRHQPQRRRQRDDRRRGSAAIRRRRLPLRLRHRDVRRLDRDRRASGPGPREQRHRERKPDSLGGSLRVANGPNQTMSVSGNASMQGGSLGRIRRAGRRRQRELLGDVLDRVRHSDDPVPWKLDVECELRSDGQGAGHLRRQRRAGGLGFEGGTFPAVTIESGSIVSLPASRGQRLAGGQWLTHGAGFARCRTARRAPSARRRPSASDRRRTRSAVPCRSRAAHFWNGHPRPRRGGFAVLSSPTPLCRNLQISKTGSGSRVTTRHHGQRQPDSDRARTPSARQRPVPQSWAARASRAGASRGRGPSTSRATSRSRERRRLEDSDHPLRGQLVFDRELRPDGRGCGLRRHGRAVDLDDRRRFFDGHRLGLVDRVGRGVDGDRSTTVNGSLTVSGTFDVDGSVTVGATATLDVGAWTTDSIGGSLTASGTLIATGTLVFDGANFTRRSALQRALSQSPDLEDRLGIQVATGITVSGTLAQTALGSFLSTTRRSQSWAVRACRAEASRGPGSGRRGQRDVFWDHGERRAVDPLWGHLGFERRVCGDRGRPVVFDGAGTQYGLESRRDAPGVTVQAGSTASFSTVAAIDRWSSSTAR